MVSSTGPFGLSVPRRAADARERRGPWRYLPPCSAASASALWAWGLRPQRAFAVLATQTYIADQYISRALPLTLPYVNIVWF